MTDGPKWMKDAVIEIDSQYAAWEQDSMGGNPVINLDRLLAVESIILKHYPDDRGSGRLVYLSKVILEDLRYIFNTPGEKPDQLPISVLARNIARLESALAEYEKFVRNQEK